VVKVELLADDLPGTSRVTRQCAVGFEDEQHRFP
jgi:hypothetical protein